MNINIIPVKDVDAGFSMIEVLIAMAIFAIGSLAIASMYYSTGRSIRSSDEVTQAVYIADNYLSRMLTVDYSNMPASVGSFNQGKYTINVSINPATPVVRGNTTITVSVTWDRPGASYSLDYSRAETRSSGI